MSILQKLADRNKSKGVFGVIAGPRLAGKTTTAGTLPGSTFLLQAASRETNSESAKKLAELNGNTLVIGEFATLEELSSALLELQTSDFDNIYIDGISAITEIKFAEDEVQKIMKKDNWGAYREIASAMQNFIMLAKSVAERHDKNVFMTLALEEKFDSLGNLVQLNPVCKGNATISQIKGLCPTVVIPRVVGIEEDGTPIRALLTRSEGLWPARIDSLLDNENPGTVPLKGKGMGLSRIISLVKGDK